MIHFDLKFEDTLYKYTDDGERKTFHSKLSFVDEFSFAAKIFANTTRLTLTYAGLRPIGWGCFEE